MLSASRKPFQKKKGFGGGTLRRTHHHHHHHQFTNSPNRLPRIRNPTEKNPKMAPTSIKSVLISESVDPRCRAILEENGILVTEKQNMKKEELIAEIGLYDGLVVRSATKVTADIISAAHNLKIIGRAGTGVDNVDVNAATHKGIIVMNTPSGNTISAAELTCALLMSLSRNVPQAVMSMKEGNWDRKKVNRGFPSSPSFASAHKAIAVAWMVPLFIRWLIITSDTWVLVVWILGALFPSLQFMGSELYGKVLGIVGLGRIGKEVATRMQAFGMKTVGYDPITPLEVSASWGVEQMSLEQLWPLCDYITVHTPLMPSTVGLLNDNTFAKCKKGVKVVNCARGGIIDEAALLRALESGQCGGAGLDVFNEEPPKNRSLVDHPNVISCPHLGASTKEAQARCGEDIAQQIVDMVKGKNLVGAVNAQVLAGTFSQESHLLIKLGESLGALLQSCSAAKKPLSRVQITTQGECMKSCTGYMKSAVLVGLLSQDCECRPNLINVLSLSKQKEIEVSQTHGASESDGVCKVELVAGGCSYRVSGAVQGGVPVLLELNGSVFRQPIALCGNLLFFRASGGPQLLSSMAGVLAANGVEIQSFSAPTAHPEDPWHCVGVSSLLPDLSVLKPSVKDAAQLQI